MALSGRTVWTAISCDPSVWDHCAGGVYRRVNGVWARVLAMNPGPMAVEGDTVAVLEQALTVMGDSTAHWTTAIRLTRDGGATWASLGNPCPTAQGWLSAAAFDDGGLLAVCEAEGAGGGAQKGLLASADLTGTRWTVRSRLPQPGTGMGLSLQPRSGTSLQPVSAGLLWGHRSPLLTTADGGITWTAHRDVADGDVRIVRSADAAPGGVDSALVWDPDRGATLLLLSTDRAQTWRELTSFRMLPCCGG